jgi:AcrR family transcriptional regulator
MSSASDVPGGASLGGEPEPVTGEDGGGLRERKKLRTRRTIVDTAHVLFAEQGYDATTVEAIAAGADVSVRTFFRYFAGKEDVALAPLDEVGDLALDALRRRPADEPPLAALRAAALDAWVAMSPEPRSFRIYAEHLLIADGTPAVSAAVLHRMMRIGDRLAAAITPRFEPLPPTGSPGGPGRGPVGAPVGGIDLRPQLTAAAFLAAAQVGVRAWCESGSQDLAELLTIAEHCVGQLAPADPPSRPASEQPPPAP